MSSPPDIQFPVATIDDAELAGWAYLSVSCRCGITWLNWQSLRRYTRYRRFDEIIPRLRCSNCGRRVNAAALYWRGGRDNRDERERVLFEQKCNP